MKEFTGTCVCPGIVEGKIKTFKQDGVYNKTDIVVLENWVTQDVLALKEAGAVISATGGITCHASIIARELGIPAIISADISELKDGQEVIVDAAKGSVKLK
jgi:pyruvate,water dikinase